MKKILVFISLILFLMILVACSDSQKNSNYEIHPFITKSDQSMLLYKLPSFLIGKDKEHSTKQIKILSNQTFQIMDGFGAAMTESSAYLLASMSDEKRQKTLNELFSKTDGIGIDFIRIPMGASDFSLDNFSYNDIPAGETDLSLFNFSLERDERYVIPILKEILKINPDIKFMGTPWSAPAWMKDSQSMNGGSLLPQYYQSYANYFLKFIEGYKEHGIEIYALSPQNEPLHQTSNYPSMYMHVHQQTIFIDFLGKTLRENGHQTLIIAYDHNWDNYEYPMTVLSSEKIDNFVAGSAFHCYSGDVSNQDFLNKNYPDKGIWFTECSGGNWATDFGSNISWNMENVFIGSINFHSKGVMLWNLALNEENGPQNGGCSNCRGVLTINNDETITKNEEYYSIGHFSKFVVPNAKRVLVESSYEDIIATGFLNPDGSIVVVLHNKSFEMIDLNLNIDGVLGNYIIPSSSTVSLVIDPV